MDTGSRRILSVRVAKGRRRDFHLWKQSRVWVHPRVQIACDTGYQGILKLHANCLKPVKATKKHPLTKEQKQSNRAIN